GACDAPRAPAQPGRVTASARKFNVRRYPNRKLLIKPSKAAVRRVRERLASEMRTLRGGIAMAIIRTLNPLIRSWAAYYRAVTNPASYTHPASGRSPPASAGNQRFNLHSPRGLLEPCAAINGTHGCERAPARQRAGATRLLAPADARSCMCGSA